MNVSKTFIYGGAVNSTKREASQQRCETVTNDGKLHNIPVDVDGIEPLIHVHHVIGLFTEGVQINRSLFGGKTTLADGVRPISFPPRLGWTHGRVSAAGVAAAAGGLLTTDGWNPNMVPFALW